MDLTAARLFWHCKQKQRNLVCILDRWYGHKTIGVVRVDTIFATFLYAFSALHPFLPCVGLLWMPRYTKQKN